MQQTIRVGNAVDCCPRPPTPTILDFRAMEKRGGVFKDQDDGPLRKRPKRELADNVKPFTRPDQRSCKSCAALAKKILILLAVLLDVDDESLPIQIASEHTRLKANWETPRYAGSRLPYVEPTTSMSTDGDDDPTMDAPVVASPTDDQEAASSFEEIRRKAVDLKAQYPAYREDLEAAEAQMNGDTGPVKLAPPIVLKILDIMVTQELCASEIRRRYYDLACEDLRRIGAHESRVKEADDERARQVLLHDQALQLRVWKEKMWKIWG